MICKNKIDHGNNEFEEKQYYRSSNNFFNLQNRHLYNSNITHDICYEKINNEILWFLSALTNNVSKIYSENNLNAHFGFLIGTNYNELGSYDSCLKKKDMKYFLTKLT